MASLRMIDVSPKAASFREAVAEGRITLNRATLELVQQEGLPKGDVLGAARLAGILAAKKTPDLIPLCHPIQLTYAEVELEVLPADTCIRIQATVRCTDRTGCEMEALAAVSAAALTIYDMCKSHDQGMRISDIRLLRKTGGKSQYEAPPQER